MRITTARLIGLAALLVLLLGGAGLGEPPGAGKDGKKPAEEKKPSQLEELIAQALQGNPDVRVAEAKMREAEAELNRTRLQVIQKIVAHQHNTEALESAVRTAEARLVVAEANYQLAEADNKRMAEINRKGGASKSDVDAIRAKAQQAAADIEAAKAALQAAKADHAKAQAELPYLLGKATKDDKAAADATRRGLEWLSSHQIEGSSATANALRALAEANLAAWAAGQQPQGTVADKLRKSLDTPINLKVVDQHLDDLIAYLGRVTDVPVVTNRAPRDLLEKKLTLDVKNVSVGAAFQLLEDLAGVQFGVRDYGILVTDKLPPGVVSLHEFWKAGDKAKAGADKK
jgi:hypothetical protein